MLLVYRFWCVFVSVKKKESVFSYNFLWKCLCVGILSKFDLLEVWIVMAELMLLGFISLLLTVFQNTISKICVHQDVLDNMLPCKRNKTAESEGQNSHVTTTSHFQTFFSSSISGTAKRLLAEEESAASERGYCAQKVSIIICWPIGAYDTCMELVMQ